MIKYCLDKWNKNRERLEEVLSKDTKLNNCEYEYLVKLVVDHILNDEDCGYGEKWDSSEITVVDNGNYQGTQLFIIPAKTYQPSEYEYLMTYVSYGSCSGCDTLLGIQDWSDKEPPADTQLKDSMVLCKDLITNMIKPYNCGWRENKEFETVVM